MDGNLDDVIDFARWWCRHDDFLWHGHVMNVRDSLAMVPRRQQQNDPCCLLMPLVMSEYFRLLASDLGAEIPVLNLGRDNRGKTGKPKLNTRKP